MENSQDPFLFLVPTVLPSASQNGTQSVAVSKLFSQAVQPFRLSAAFFLCQGPCSSFTLWGGIPQVSPDMGLCLSLTD